MQHEQYAFSFIVIVSIFAEMLAADNLSVRCCVHSALVWQASSACVHVFYRDFCVTGLLLHASPVWDVENQKMAFCGIFDAWRV